MITPQQVNAWRVIPRALVAMYGLQLWRIGEWYMALPDPTAGQAGFVGTVYAAAAAIFGLYTKTGDATK